MLRRSNKQNGARSGSASIRSSGMNSSSSSTGKRGKVSASHLLYFLVGSVFLCTMLMIRIVLLEANPKESQKMPDARRRTTEEATAAMLSHPSKYVDEEKQLKRELKKLVAYQEKGQCLNAPVATRWMGDNKPVWTCVEVGMSNLGPLKKDDNINNNSKNAAKQITDAVQK